jgi:hypothetical protein
MLGGQDGAGRGCSHRAAMRTSCGGRRQKTAGVGSGRCRDAAMPKHNGSKRAHADAAANTPPLPSHPSSSLDTRLAHVSAAVVTRLSRC